MRRMSTAVLSAALVTGMAGFAMTPAAFAKKKEEAPAGPQYTQAVAVAYNKGKAAFAAKDLTGAEAAIVEAEAAAKTNDDRYLTTSLRYQLAVEKIALASAGTNGASDQTPLIAPLEALIANPATPADLRPKLEFSRASIAYDQKNYALAQQMLTAAQAHGSTDPNLPLLMVQTKVRSGNTAGGLADLDALVATGKPQTEELYKYAITQSNNAGMRADTLKWLQRWVTAYPSPQTWHTAIAFYGLSAKPIAKLDKRQRVDLFRLMRQTKALADQNDYEEYAQSTIDIGLPDEAKAVVDEGKATGKIPAMPSSTIKAISTDAASAIALEGSFDALEKKAGAAANGALSAQTGDAYLGRGNYTKAAALYRQALAKGGVNADEVNTHLGIALAMSGDKAGAKTAFAAVTGTPRSDIAGFWTVYLDHPPAG